MIRQAPTAWKPPSTWSISPVVAGNQVGEQRDARLGDGLGVLDVPAERRALGPHLLELLEAGDALRRDACGSGRRPPGSRGCPSARGRGRGSAPSTRTRPSPRPSSRRRASASVLSKSSPTIEPPSRHQRERRDRERLQRVRRHLQRDRDVLPRRVEEAAAEARLGREADRVQHAVERGRRRCPAERVEVVLVGDVELDDLGRRSAGAWPSRSREAHHAPERGEHHLGALLLRDAARRENAIEASLRTPVTRMRLPSQQHGVVAFSLRAACWSGGVSGTRARAWSPGARARAARTRRVSVAAMTSST